jgi:hypothetical protein
VLPGKYHVALKVPGVTPELGGEVAVEGDPLASFSDADRRARQAVLMSIYGMQKTLSTALHAAQALSGQIDSIRKDLTSEEAVTTKRVDDLAARIAQLPLEINREISAGGSLLRPIETYSGLPTGDQQRQVDWVFEDATKSVNDLNHMVQTEIPGLYTQIAKKEWPNRIQPVPPIRK